MNKVGGLSWVCLVEWLELAEVVGKEIFQDIPHLSGNTIHDAHTAALM